MLQELQSTSRVRPYDPAPGPKLGGQVVAYELDVGVLLNPQRHGVAADGEDLTLRWKSMRRDLHWCR